MLPYFERRFYAPIPATSSNSGVTSALLNAAVTAGSSAAQFPALQPYLSQSQSPLSPTSGATTTLRAVLLQRCALAEAGRAGVLETRVGGLCAAWSRLLPARAQEPGAAAATAEDRAAAAAVATSIAATTHEAAFAVLAYSNNIIHTSGSGSDGDGDGDWYGSDSSSSSDSDDDPAPAARAARARARSGRRARTEARRQARFARMRRRGLLSGAPERLCVDSTLVAPCLPPWTPLRRINNEQQQKQQQQHQSQSPVPSPVPSPSFAAANAGVVATAPVLALPLPPAAAADAAIDSADSSPRSLVTPELAAALAAAEEVAAVAAAAFTASAEASGIAALLPAPVAPATTAAAAARAATATDGQGRPRLSLAAFVLARRAAQPPPSVAMDASLAGSSSDDKSAAVVPMSDHDAFAIASAVASAAAASAAPVASAAATASAFALKAENAVKLESSSTVSSIKTSNTHVKPALTPQPASAASTASAATTIGPTTATMTAIVPATPTSAAAATAAATAPASAAVSALREPELRLSALVPRALVRALRTLPPPPLLRARQTPQPQAQVPSSQLQSHSHSQAQAPGLPVPAPPQLLSLLSQSLVTAAGTRVVQHTAPHTAPRTAPLTALHPGQSQRQGMGDDSAGAVVAVDRAAVRADIASECLGSARARCAVLERIMKFCSKIMSMLGIFQNQIVQERRRMEATFQNALAGIFSESNNNDGSNNCGNSSSSDMPSLSDPGGDVPRQQRRERLQLLQRRQRALVAAARALTPLHRIAEAQLANVAAVLLAEKQAHTASLPNPKSSLRFRQKCFNKAVAVETAASAALAPRGGRAARPAAATAAAATAAAAADPAEAEVAAASASAGARASAAVRRHSAEPVFAAADNVHSLRRARGRARCEAVARALRSWGRACRRAWRARAQQTQSGPKKLPQQQQEQERGPRPVPPMPRLAERRRALRRWAAAWLARTKTLLAQEAAAAEAPGA